VNTEWWRGRPDKAEDKLPEFAASYGLGEAPPDLAELRAVLRRLIEDVSERDLRLLDGFLARGRIRRRLRDGAIVLEPVVCDWDWVLSEVASSFVPLLDRRDRLKICANSECQWTFLDNSRNRSRRWCGASACGNAAKVRRFRERQRTREGEGFVSRARMRSPASTRSDGERHLSR